MAESNQQLIKTIRDGFEVNLEDQLDRLKFIYSLNPFIDNDEYFTAPVPSYWFYQEAIDCFYYGNFIGTIILSQIALEDRLRNFFRISNYKFTTVRKRKIWNVNDVTFADLINESIAIKLISPEEGNSLHHLRKDLRNLYTHSKDKNFKVQTNIDGKKDSKSLPYFHMMDMKIRTSLVEPNTKSDAEDALRILVQIYNSICMRSPTA